LPNPANHWQGTLTVDLSPVSGSTYKARVRFAHAGGADPGPAMEDTIGYDSLSPGAPGKPWYAEGAYSTSTTITFNWTHAYDQGPSGIADYYLEVRSTEASPVFLFANWLGSAPNHKTVSGGVDGRTYVARLYARDAAGNTGPWSLLSDGVTVDMTPPGVVLSSTAPNPTNMSVPVTVAFTESVTGFDSSDLVLGHGSLVSGSFGGSGSSYWFTVQPEWQGAVTVSIPANAATDGAGNPSTAAEPLSRTYDTVGPSVPEITSPLPELSPGTVVCAWDASIDPVGSDFEPGAGIKGYDVRVGSTLGGNDMYWAASSTSRSHTVSGLQHGRTYHLQVLARDNLDNVSGWASRSFPVDAIAPQAQSIVSQTGYGPTQDPTAVFAIHFSEDVFGFTEPSDLDITLTGSVAYAGVAISGSAQDFVVTFTGLSGDGTLALAVAMGPGVEDIVGNDLSASVTSAPVIFDATAPTAGPITPRSGTGPTNARTVTFDVHFSEPVMNFNNALYDLVVIETGSLTHYGDVVIEGGPQLYAVTVEEIYGDGTLSLAVQTGEHVWDLAGNALATSATSNAITFDFSPPAALIVAPRDGVGPSKASTVTFDIQFNEVVTGFNNVVTALVFTESGSVAHGGASIAGAGRNYVVTAMNIVGAGQLALSARTGASIRDVAGNSLTWSATGAVRIDRSVPLVSSLSINGGATYATDRNVTLTLDAEDPDVPEGSASGLVEMAFSLDGVSFDPWTAWVDTTSFELPDSDEEHTIYARVRDAAQNESDVASASITLKRSIPSATVNQAATQTEDPTENLPIHFTAVFSEPAYGFEAGDVVNLGSASGLGITLNTTDSITWDIQIDSAVDDGTIEPFLPAGSVEDVAGNGITDSSDGGGDNVVAYDVSPPTVTVNRAATQRDPTSTAPLYFDVVFSEPVWGFGHSDVFIGGTATVDSYTVMTVSPSEYRIEVQLASADGTVTASVLANAARDMFFNWSLASTSDDNIITVDTIRPTVSVEQHAAQGDPTGTLPIVFDVEFSEPVTGFGEGDIVFSGTAIILDFDLVGPFPGDRYEIRVTDVADSGSVIPSIPEGVLMDMSNEINHVSTSLDNRVDYDAQAPSVTLTQGAGQGDPARTLPIVFDMTLSDPVVDLDVADITNAGTASGVVFSLVPISDVEFTVEATATTDGTIVPVIAAGVWHDTAGNGNSAATGPDGAVRYDATAPTLTIEQGGTQSDPTASLPIAFDVAFSEEVVDFAAASVTNTGTARNVVFEIIGTGPVYTLRVVSANDGTIVPVIAEDAVHDAAGNGNAASASVDNSVAYEASAPTVTVEQGAGQSDPAGSLPIVFDVTFSELVDGFAYGDVQIGGSATGVTYHVSGSGALYTIQIDSVGADGTITAAVGAAAAQDLAGKSSAASTSEDGQVRYDTAPPTGTLIIDGGTAIATSTAVTLGLTDGDLGSGASEMRFSNDGGATWSPWQPFSTSTAWDLGTGDGIRVVRGQLKDGVGLVTTTPFADSIILDTEPIEVTLLGDTAVSRGVKESCQFEVVATGNTGVIHYQWFFDSLTDDAMPIPGATGPLLQIINIGPYDEGEYYCEVWDVTETQYSSPRFQLSVIPEVPAAGGLAVGLLTGLTALVGAAVARRKRS